jgi:co-chaperonin GroES (HSP10)
VNPRNIRPRRDWALVLADARKTVLASGIILPGEETGVEKVTERAGMVIRLGPSVRAGVMGLKEEDRIVFRGFIKHHMPIETDELWEDGSKKEYFLMDIADVFAVTDPDVNVGVFSGRPSQSAVESVDDDGNVKMRV